jgi:hypothetical protein
LQEGQELLVCFLMLKSISDSRCKTLVPVVICLSVLLWTRRQFTPQRRQTRRDSRRAALAQKPGFSRWYGPFAMKNLSIIWPGGSYELHSLEKTSTAIFTPPLTFHDPLFRLRSPMRRPACFPSRLRPLVFLVSPSRSRAVDRISVKY